MKTFSLSLLAALYTLLSFGQTGPEETPANNLKPGSPVFISADQAAQASAQEAVYRGRQRAEMDCAHFKRQRNFGAVFTGIGGGFLASGIAMTIAGNIAINNDLNNNLANNYGYQNPVPYHDYLLRNTGVAFTLIGVAGLAIGIPNLVIGSVKYHRNCGGYYDRYRDRERSYISTNGSSLALNF